MNRNQPTSNLSDLRQEDFTKSSFSQGNTDGCVHLAPLPGGGAALWESDGYEFSPEHFTVVPQRSLEAFIAGAKAGEFDHLL